MCQGCGAADETISNPQNMIFVILRWLRRSDPEIHEVTGASRRFSLLAPVKLRTHAQGQECYPSNLLARPFVPRLAMGCWRLVTSARNPESEIANRPRVASGGLSVPLRSAPDGALRLVPESEI